MVNNPLVIDLFAGLGGWTRGFLAEGYEAIGFDIERHRYPKMAMMASDGGVKHPGGDTYKKNSKPCGKFTDQRYPSAGTRSLPAINGWTEYPGQLVIQDVLTLHGSQFRNAACIVASPPCQEFSYMAMPWKRAKQIAAALRGQGEFPEGYTGSRSVAQLTALFDAYFRIQREASEAAGHHIPLVVENVRGAQPWVGRAPWNYGSYYLWGYVPAIMPFTYKAQKCNPDGTDHGLGSWFAIADSKERGAMKGESGSWFNDYKQRPDSGMIARLSKTSSKSPARKAASAMIAEIPLPLAQWIAHVYHPRNEAVA